MHGTKQNNVSVLTVFIAFPQFWHCSVCMWMEQLVFQESRG